MFPSSSGGRHEPVRITDHTLTERVLGKRGWGGCISSVAAGGLMGLSQLCGESSVLPILESQLQGPKLFPLMMSPHYGWEGFGGHSRQERTLPARQHSPHPVPHAGGCACAWLQGTSRELWPRVDSEARADPSPQSGSGMGPKPEQEGANVLVPAEAFKKDSSLSHGGGEAQVNINNTKPCSRPKRPGYNWDIVLTCCPLSVVAGAVIK